MIKKLIFCYVVISGIFLASASAKLEVKQFLLADINLQDCKKNQTESNPGTVHISCSLINNAASQGDIRYGVQLIDRSTKTPQISDFKVYEKTLSLAAGQRVPVEMDYTVPSFLTGEYEIWGIVKTTEGLPLSSNFIGKLTLTAKNGTFIRIDDSTCKLHVDGEVATKSYTLVQGVDVDADEVLRVECQAVSLSSTQNIEAAPFFETYRRNMFGDVVATPVLTQDGVSFKPGEKKSIVFIVPKVTDPQAYDTILSLKNKNGEGVISNKIDIHYVIHGASLTVQNVTLDKTYYEKGETVKVSISFTDSADNFWGSRKKPTDNKVKTLAVSIQGDGNQVCAEENKFPLDKSVFSSGLHEYNLPVLIGCVNPTVFIAVSDEENKSLVNKSVLFTTVKNGHADDVQAVALPSSPSKQNTSYIVGVAAIILAFIGLGIFYLKNRKSEEILKADSSIANN